jgi:hypothetical protein
VASDCADGLYQLSVLILALLRTVLSPSEVLLPLHSQDSWGMRCGRPGEGCRYPRRDSGTVVSAGQGGRMALIYCSRAIRITAHTRPYRNRMPAKCSINRSS